jgi:hypothetical protein
MVMKAQRFKQKTENIKKPFATSMAILGRSQKRKRFHADFRDSPLCGSEEDWRGLVRSGAL